MADYAFCPRCGGALDNRLIKQGEPERLVCGGCQFVFYLDPKLAAGEVVETEAGIVLVQRAIDPQYGKWVFPGGYVDRGEHPEAAAVREAAEEAGVDVALEGLLGVYAAPIGSPVVIVVYRGRMVGGAPRALDESLAVAEFPAARLPWDELAFPTTRAALRDYVAATAAPRPRRPDER